MQVNALRMGSWSFEVLVGTGMDVTEREQLRQALRRSAGTLRLLVDGIAALVITMTTDDELEFVNQQVLDYFGKTTEEMKDARHNPMCVDQGQPLRWYVACTDIDSASPMLRRPQKNSEEPVPATYRSLSRREAGVLQMIARGMSNKCIARSLGIAPETVKTHAKGILGKLEARTRAQAVARAESIGLLSPTHRLE
jgi:DNA-binding CsgD family transcriptional regulator